MAESRGYEVVQTIEERLSGAKKSRPGLTKVLEGAHRGEFQVVLVWAIDRLGRSMMGVLETVQRLDGYGCPVLSHQEPWLAMEGPTRPLLLAVFGWAAEMERAKLIERTQAGLATARSKGIRLGRPRVEVDVDRALKLIKGGASLRDAARKLGVGIGTLQRAIKAAA